MNTATLALKGTEPQEPNSTSQYRDIISNPSLYKDRPFKRAIYFTRFAHRPKRRTQRTSRLIWHPNTCHKEPWFRSVVHCATIDSSPVACLRVFFNCYWHPQIFCQRPIAFGQVRVRWLHSRPAVPFAQWLLRSSPHAISKDNMKESAQTSICELNQIKVSP